MAIGTLIIYALAVTVALLWTVHSAKGSGAEGARTQSPKSTPAALTAAPEHCLSAQGAIRFYRSRTNAWRARFSDRFPDRIKWPTCFLARRAAAEWMARASSARRSYERWHEKHTLRDFPFSPGGRAWHRAVRESQKVFPGTESWLLSCSAAEGGWGRWVGYAGVSYSDSLRDSDTVGGPMQYRFSTFTGHMRRALEYVRDKHYFVPRALYDQTNAWTSALGQALAAGWARYTGNDNSHWSASWGNGC